MSRVFRIYLDGVEVGSIQDDGTYWERELVITVPRAIPATRRLKVRSERTLEDIDPLLTPPGDKGPQTVESIDCFADPATPAWGTYPRGTEPYLIDITDIEPYMGTHKIPRPEDGRLEWGLPPGTWEIEGFLYPKHTKGLRCKIEGSRAVVWTELPWRTRLWGWLTRRPPQYPPWPLDTIRLRRTK